MGFPPAFLFVPFVVGIIIKVFVRGIRVPVPFSFTASVPRSWWRHLRHMVLVTDAFEELSQLRVVVWKLAVEGCEEQGPVLLVEVQG